MFEMTDAGIRNNNVKMIKLPAELRDTIMVPVIDALRIAFLTYLIYAL
jgi:hypothetical protein